jgi:hypothetical protein
MQIYNKKGALITMEEFNELRIDESYSFLKKDYLPDGKIISTVWLGIDHRYNKGNGKPIIFETMVFVSDMDYTDIDRRRYETEEEAIKGHERMVEKWSK